MSRSVAIVVEWETVLSAGRRRGIQCLAAINRQVREVTENSGVATEVIVCFDPSEASEGSVSEALEEAGQGRGWPGRLTVTAAPERLDYYQKKNYGFTLSTSEVVIFVDSDLIPEKEWLANLLGGFVDFRKAVIVGRTHMDTATLYERAVALFWIFDARDPSSEVRRTGRLVSNNIAFRRPVFAHFPFPVRPTFRGQCSELAAILAARGIALYEHPAARASHPAPDGVRQFLSRAFHAGKDQYFYDDLENAGSIGDCVRQWRTDLGHVIERSGRRRSAIQAGLPSRILGFLLGLIYYSTKAAGYSLRSLQEQGGAQAGGRHQRDPVSADVSITSL